YLHLQDAYIHFKDLYMWYPVAGTTVPYLRNCGTRLLEQWCNSGRNLQQMSKHHQVVTHYMTEHGYIPLWVLVNVLTFGKIENFYKNMKPEDKTVVSKQFNLQPNELAKFMHMLALARNKCAHDERFFDIKFKERIHTKSIKNFSVLGIIRATDGSYNYGTNDACHSYNVRTVAKQI
ncbi:MAG: Abi family protein, partial [Clostridia bacterium]|nr:Abi family protein [Clostridia bacterium]